jgi:aspartyl-tRNA(Asn)/glutamyl-tRNA(Gln) amidotransferase subunit C
MSVTPRDVHHIAALARVRMTPAEIDRMAEELSAILQHVDTLRTADAETSEAGGVGPREAPQRLPGELAVDPLARPPADLAPSWRDGFFVVPRLPALGAGPDGEDGP